MESFLTRLAYYLEGEVLGVLSTVDFLEGSSLLGLSCFPVKLGSTFQLQINSIYHPCESLE